MRSFHVIIADLWVKCNGKLDELKYHERRMFEDKMDEYVDWINRLRELDKAYKTWATAQEGRK